MPNAPSRRRLLAAAGMLASALAGCQGRGPRTDAGDDEDQTPSTTPTPPGNAAEYRSSSPTPGRNRVVDAAGDLREASPVRLPVSGTPAWLVAAPAPDGSRWTVVETDGAVTHWRVRADGTTEPTGTDSLPAGAPPLVAYDRPGGPGRTLAPPADAAVRARPLVVAGGPTLVYVDTRGRLVVRSETLDRFAVDALPDARLVPLPDGRVGLYGGATDRYRHGALGDTTEGSRLLVVDPAEPAVRARTAVGPPETFEGLGPLAADLDGDGAAELVTVVADGDLGARVAVFDAGGTRVATGPVHEPGWRHALAVAPFAADGVPELAVVRKPHVEHVLEFYRLVDGEARVVATDAGYSSHTYGSRVLGGGLACDADADGAVELLVPTVRRDELVAVGRTETGAAAKWSLALEGRVASNLTGTRTGGGGLAVGVGTDEGVRVWTG